jgi:hypothetical protein
LRDASGSSQQARRPHARGDLVAGGRILAEPEAVQGLVGRDRSVDVKAPATGAHCMTVFNPAIRWSSPLFCLDRPSGSGIAVSPDGAWVLYTQRDHVTNEILALELR